LWDKWNILDLLIYSTALSVIVLHSVSLGYINQIDFNFPPGDKLSCLDCNDFTRLAYLRYQERNLLAFLFILYWLLLLHFIRKIEILGVLFVILEKMLVDLFSFLVVYMVITIGFAGAFALTVGNEVQLAETWGSSIFLLFRFTLGDLQIQQVFNVNNKWANALVIIYLLLSTVLLLNLLIAMFSKSYSDVIANAKNEYMLETAQLVAAYSSSKKPVLGSLMGSASVNENLGDEESPVGENGAEMNRMSRTLSSHEIDFNKEFEDPVVESDSSKLEKLIATQKEMLEMIRFQQELIQKKFV